MEEGSREEGLDTSQVAMAGPLSAQPSSSPTSQGQHSPCHSCLDFFPVVVNYCHYKQRKTILNCNKLSRSKVRTFFINKFQH